MLDSNILEQLKGVYQALENEVILNVAKSNHEKQSELLDLVRSLASTSSKIVLNESSEESQIPKLTLDYKGAATGITFLGVPGGHEFTSLVLSILHADGKGKLPDDSILARVKRLKRVRLKLELISHLVVKTVPKLFRR